MKHKKIAATLLCLLCVATNLPAQPANTLPSSNNKTIRVGVIVKPPFVTKVNQEYIGFVPAIWQSVAKRAGLHYKFISAGDDSEVGIQALNAGKYDALIGPISVTAPRLKQAIFSRPFYVNKLNVVMLQNRQTFWYIILHMLKVFAAWSLLAYLILLLLYTLAHCLFERAHGGKNFQGPFIKAYFYSLWLATNALLSQNYEESAESPPARTIMLFWIVAGILFSSQLTAILTSAMTIAMSAANSAPGNVMVRSLYNRKVAAQKDSYAAGVATRLGGDLTPTNNLAEAFQLLAEKKVNIVLGDRLTIKYFIQKSPAINYTPGEVLAGTNEFAFAFPKNKNSALRDKVSEALTQLQDNNETYSICRIYLDPENSQDCII